MTDAPIPPGKGAAGFPDLLEFVRSDTAFTGLIVDAQGRISVTLSGVGVRATFHDPENLRGLGALLIAVADHRSAMAQKAAAEVSSDLERIAAAFITERKFDA